MKIKSSGPSNIALIKYMGKVEGTGNKPTNASISYTLDHLKTFVELELVTKDPNTLNRSKSGEIIGADVWEALDISGHTPIQLSEKGLHKFLKHFQFLKEKWQLTHQSFKIKSGNNFPSDCGLASSASSFAALTLTSAELFQKINPQSWGEDLSELSKLSRQGSGSSCRSFYSPWALWKEEGAEPVKLNQRLHSAVVVLENKKKTVSSSEAHKLVLTSPRFEGRVNRAQLKLKDLLSAIESENWKQSFEIIWDEFWDMHELFHTSKPQFSYLTKESREMLTWIEGMWKKQNHGPWVTLDAGPNIHLLFNHEDLVWAKKYMTEFKNYQVITSWDHK